MDVIKIRFLESPESVESPLNRALDEIRQLTTPRISLARPRWQPPVDIVETGGEILIRGEIAGLSSEELHLEISPTAIQISGVRKGRMQAEEARYHLAEIPCGYFERTLTLPALIDPQSAEAIYQDGFLEIRLAKRPLEQIRRIHIQRG